MEGTVTMRIFERNLKIGGEVDFGYYGEFGKDRFRLSLRFNKDTQQFEVYKHFFATIHIAGKPLDREEPEEVIMSSADLENVVREADKLATELSGHEWKDEVVSSIEG
jgi:hypothetical protein